MKKILSVFVLITMLFSMGALAHGWEVSLDFQNESDIEYFVVPPAGTGVWEVANGDLIQTVPRSAQDYDIEDFRQIITYRERLGNSFVLEFEFTHLDANWFGLAFGIPDIDETYQDNGGQGYIYIFSNPDATFPRLDFYKANEDQTPMWAYSNENYNSAKIKNGRIVAGGADTNKVRIEKDGDTVKVFVENNSADLVNAFGLDGEPTLEFTEPELDIDGFIQLATGRGRVNIHNFRLSALGDEQTPAQTDTDTETEPVTESETDPATETEEPAADDEGGLATILLIIAVLVIAAIAVTAYMKKKNK